MTQVAMIFEEEKQEALQEAARLFEKEKLYRPPAVPWIITRSCSTIRKQVSGNLGLLIRKKTRCWYIGLNGICWTAILVRILYRQESMRIWKSICQKYV